MKVLPFAVIVAFCAGSPGLARADDIGRVKVAKGQVSIERAGAAVAAGVGTRLQSADVPPHSCQAEPREHRQRPPPASSRDYRSPGRWY